MISKELLNEVLGLDVYEDDKKFSELLKINSISDNVNYNIRFLKDIENGWTEAIGNRWINIYELAHKCKEWATENKYTILTENMYPNGYFAYVLSNEQSIEQCGYLYEHKVIEDIPHNKTEPEAIFKACEYILNSIKQ